MFECLSVNIFFHWKLTETLEVKMPKSVLKVKSPYFHFSIVSDSESTIIHVKQLFANRLN